MQIFSFDRKRQSKCAISKWTATNISESRHKVHQFWKRRFLVSTAAAEIVKTIYLHISWKLLVNFGNLPATYHRWSSNWCVEISTARLIFWDCRTCFWSTKCARRTNYTPWIHAGAGFMAHISFTLEFQIYREEKQKQCSPLHVMQLRTDRNF